MNNFSNAIILILVAIVSILGYHIYVNAGNKNYQNQQTQHAGVIRPIVVCNDNCGKTEKPAAKKRKVQPKRVAHHHHKKKRVVKKVYKKRQKPVPAAVVSENSYDNSLDFLTTAPTQAVYASGRVTSNEPRYTNGLRTGKVLEQDNNYFNVSSYSEGSYANAESSSRSSSSSTGAPVTVVVEGDEGDTIDIDIEGPGGEDPDGPDTDTRTDPDPCTNCDDSDDDSRSGPEQDDDGFVNDGDDHDDRDGRSDP